MSDNYDLMAFLKTISTGAILIIAFIVVWLLLLPTKLIFILGSSYSVNRPLRKPLIFSDKRSRKVRGDLLDAISDGADRVLQHTDNGQMPYSREIIKQRGLKAVGESERKLNSGEFLVSLLITITGLLASTLSILGERLGYSSTFGSYQFIDLISLLSISATIVGVLILVLVGIRMAIIDHLVLGIDEFVFTDLSDLLTKLVWNESVAEQPTKVLRAYYLLIFADMIGEDTYSTVLSILEASMDPSTSASEVLQEYLPQIYESIETGVSVSKQ